MKLDYAFDSKLMTRKVIYRFDTEYNSSDNTYVSKNIGRIGENNSGNPIRIVTIQTGLIIGHGRILS